MVNETEQGLLELIAKDNIEIPISSMSGKLKRAKPKVALGLGLEVGDSFVGERAYGRVESDEKMKARGMRAGIDAYSEKFPQQGKILNGMIEEQRAVRENHLYFGLNDGKRVSGASYMQVMTDLGFSETRAEGLYAEIMKVSYQIQEKRGKPERSIIVG